MPQAEAILLLDHQRLTTENLLLKDQILNYKNLDILHQKQDSLKTQEIFLYKEELKTTTKQVRKLKSTQKKLILGSTLGSIVLFILGLSL